MFTAPLLNSPLLLAAVLLYQCVIVQLLGLCPLTGRTHQPRYTLHVAGMMTAAILLSALSTGLIQQLVLHPLQLGYLDTFAAILCVALSTQIALLLFQRIASLPIQDSTAANMLMPISVMAVVLLALRGPSPGLGGIVASSVIAALAFALIYLLFAALRERLLASEVPQPFRGAAIHFITAGLIALALMGFAGMV